MHSMDGTIYPLFSPALEGAFVVLVGVGLWMLYLERDLIRKGIASYRWPRAKAEVMDQIDESFSIPGYSYPVPGSGLVSYPCKGYHYQYKVGHRTYHSQNYCYGGYLDKFPATFRIGQHITIFYDPLDPREAVIKRGLTPGAISGILPILLGISGLVIMHFTNAS